MSRRDEMLALAERVKEMADRGMLAEFTIHIAFNMIAELARALAEQEKDDSQSTEPSPPLPGPSS